jgi:hypothetical protein
MNEAKLRRIIEELVLEIGQQVTDEYEFNNGLWEGISVYNAKTIDKAMVKLLTHLKAQDSLDQLIKEIEGIKTIGEVHSGSHDKWVDISKYDLIRKDAVLETISKMKGEV